MEEKRFCLKYFLVIFMYNSIDFNDFKDSMKINLDDVSLEQFNNIAKYLNVIGIQPKLKKNLKKMKRFANYPEKS